MAFVTPHGLLGVVLQLELPMDAQVQLAGCRAFEGDEAVPGGLAAAVEQTTGGGDAGDPLQTTQGDDRGHVTCHLRHITSVVVLGEADGMPLKRGDTP